MDEDKFNNNDEELNNQPIDGQIGIEELYIREEDEEQPPQPLTPIDGQLSFSDLKQEEEKLATQEQENKKENITLDTKQKATNTTENEKTELEEKGIYKDKEKEQTNQESEVEKTNTVCESKTEKINTSQEDKSNPEQENVFINQDKPHALKEENEEENVTQDKELKDFFSTENMPDSDLSYLFDKDIKSEENSNKGQITGEKETSNAQDEGLNKFFDTSQEDENDFNNSEDNNILKDIFNNNLDSKNDFKYSNLKGETELEEDKKDNGFNINNGEQNVNEQNNNTQEGYTNNVEESSDTSSVYNEEITSEDNSYGEDNNQEPAYENANNTEDDYNKEEDFQNDNQTLENLNDSNNFANVENSDKEEENDSLENSYQNNSTENEEETNYNSESNLDDIAEENEENIEDNASNNEEINLNNLDTNNYEEDFTNSTPQDIDNLSAQEEKEPVTPAEEENVNKTENKEKVVKVKVNKPKATEQNFFENDENSQLLKDVDQINKDYKEVDVSVGRDVFAGYSHEKSTTSEGTVNIVEKVYNENSGEDVVDGMLYKNLDTVLHESMIPYSEHVILDRALPRVEDGLKPVQRRILYSMMELGVTPDKPFRKSARIVGDCLGKYHPHGDKSVYDAMVRMAQPFNTNELLVSGHGNFGSVDGDGAAAMRYTEARLAPLAMELLRDLDKNTVKWGLNFDDTLKEPEILPGRFPNLLVNGSTGIAVGLATNIPPHNLAEVIDGVIAYINNPSIKLKEMLKIIKGPDFPTGGLILSNSEINQAYETGKGKIYLRAKMHIESNGSDKKYIVITELPYQVNKSALLQKIAGYREENKYNLGDISEIRDESDRQGLRAVIRVKKDADIKAIYESLLKNTELQTTFGINMVAIANGKPKQMSLLDIISYYAEYQREIIFRRSKYDLEQAKEREHILSGLIIAIKNIDAVVKIIKTSQNTTEAKKRLRDKFNLSERQAQAILDMRLARLTSLEVYKLEAELKKLRELIKELTAVINSKKLQYNIVKDELSQIKRQYKSDRKTKILKNDETIKIDAEPKEPVSQNVIILKNAYGNFKCVNQRQYNYAQKEVNDNNTVYDIHTLKFETESSKTLLAFSNLGNCFKVDVSSFSESRYRDKGVNEKDIFKELGSKETIVALFNAEDTTLKQNLIFLTKQGMIKKTELTEYALLKKYFQGMKLKEDDEILTVVKEPKNYTVVFVTRSGMVLNAENSDIPLQGRISGGVKGINLSNNDYCVGASLAIDGGEVLAVTDRGFAKRVLISNIDKMVRYRKGLKFINFTSDNGKQLIYATVVTNPFVVGVIDSENQLHFRNTDLVPIEPRTGKGKPVEKLKKSVMAVRAFGINN